MKWLQRQRTPWCSVCHKGREKPMPGPWGTPLPRHMMVWDIAGAWKWSWSSYLPWDSHLASQEQPGQPTHWKDRKHQHDLLHPFPPLSPHCMSWLCSGQDRPMRMFPKAYWTCSRTHKDSDYPGHSLSTTVYEVLLWTEFVPSKFICWRPIPPISQNVTFWR